MNLCTLLFIPNTKILLVNAPIKSETSLIPKQNLLQKRRIFLESTGSEAMSFRKVGRLQFLNYLRSLRKMRQVVLFI